MQERIFGFVMDHSDASGWSKYDALTIECARRSRRFRWFSDGANQTSVMQCGDGMIVCQRECPTGWCVFHDFSQAYSSILGKVSVAICLGESADPGISRRTLRFGSYPVDFGYVKIPRTTDVVVVGRWKLSIAADILSALQSLDGRVRLCLGTEGCSEEREQIGMLIEDPLRAAGRDVTVEDCLSECMLDFRMRTAGKIVHISSGGGRLSAAAMLYHKEENVPYVGFSGKDFDPQSIDGFITEIEK